MCCHNQVRELMKHAEVEVKALKRTRVGGLRIAGMSIGQVLVSECSLNVP
jgi:16S rRNA U516 pseudouridylate synthase RsuA-like enzyme